eukprot:5602137-Ditylum_brightwellii.AAC.1
MSSLDNEWDATSYSTWGSENDQAITFDGYNTDETSSTKESTKESNASTSTGSDVPSLISRQHSDDTSNRSYNKEVLDLEVDDASDKESIFLSKKNYSQNLDKDWLLLDNQSTVNLMCNPRYVKNIRTVPEKLAVRTVSGTAKTNQKCNVPSYGEAWFMKGGIANILSLHL